MKLSEIKKKKTFYGKNYMQWNKPSVTKVCLKKLYLCLSVYSISVVSKEEARMQ